jgi:hypothetical protein
LVLAHASLAESKPPPKLKKPWVALIDVAMFLHTCSLEGSCCFMLIPVPEPSAYIALALAELVNLKDVPKSMTTS